MSPTNPPTNHRRLVSVAQVPHTPGYEWLTTSSLRHLVFWSSPRLNSKCETVAGNGLQEAGAIIRIGRRVLIDLDCFDDWVDSHRDLGVRQGKYSSNEVSGNVEDLVSKDWNSKDNLKFI